MRIIPHLRSPYARVGRLVYFGRMLDKIRLHLAGVLPPEYAENVGDARPLLFDARCCRFLGLRHSDLVERVRLGGSDQEILDWAESRGARRSDEECSIWNHHMLKLGWRDEVSPRLRMRIQEYGLEDKPILTYFDLFDYDEGRDPARAQPWLYRPPVVVVVMGVSGSGKSTIGTALAEDLGWRFSDADEFHPPENIAKMSSGTPLTDADREPWLRCIRARIDELLRFEESGVIACSALKHSYREVLRAGPQVRFVHLNASPELLRHRIGARTDHFMKPNMLESQLATLEPPHDALTVDVTPPPPEIVATIRAALDR